ncbi:DUF1127 domain-containing protein [Methylibium sp.]|uniref:DUF1127 domain-containing protein n=1 Tax=Methylibium sp. TaxID=2067992 RepID=UPI003D0EEBB2
MPKLAIERARRADAPATGRAGLGRGLAALAMPWHGLARALARLQRRRQQRHEQQLLDPHALRDLGLDRSELGSYDAEAAGAVDCTRRRVFNVEVG